MIDPYNKMTAVERYEQHGLVCLTLDERPEVRYHLEVEAQLAMSKYDRCIWYNINRTPDLVANLEAAALTALEALEAFPSPRHFAGRNGSGHVC